MTSAPKVLTGKINRLKTDQFWVQYKIRVNGLPVDVRSMGFGVEADSDTRSMTPITMPVTIVGDAFDTVEILTPTPGAAGLGAITLRSPLKFDLRLYMAGEAGQITIHTAETTIDPKRTTDMVYEEGGLYPEVFSINILTDTEPEQIEGSLQWPGLKTAGFTTIVPLEQYGAMTALPLPVRDTFYRIKNRQIIDGKSHDPGLYLRATDGTIIALSTTILS